MSATRSSPRTLPKGFAREYRLHEQLKQYYAAGGQGLEVEIQGCLVDVATPGRLIEIQTANFSALRGKLAKLLPAHKVTVVFPVPVEKFIVWLSPSDRKELCRRRSPKRGQWFDVFKELPYVARFLSHKHFSLDVVLTRENEFRVKDGNGSWRRGGASTVDREVLEVLMIEHFKNALSYLRILPLDLAEPFTSRDVAQAIDIPLWLAQRIMYSLRIAGAVFVTGKRGNAFLYARKNSARAKGDPGPVITIERT